MPHPGRTPNGLVPENQERGGEDNKKEKTRADGMYEYERKRAKVGTPELIVTEEHHARCPLPHERLVAVC